MKYSKYNNIVEDEEYIFLYNSLKGSFARIKRDQYNLKNPKLAEHGFIVEDDKDELLTYKYGYFNELFVNDTLNLSISTTMDCNLSCPYCFEDGNKSNQYLSDEVINSLVKFLIKRKDRRIHITWFGGEPLLSFESIVKINKLLDENKIKYEAIIITNGTLFTDKIIEQLDSLCISSVQITLDGIRDLHNKKRFFNNGKGTFDVILSNVEKILKQTKARVFLKTNIDKTNIDSYPELEKYIHSLFYEYILSKQLKLTENYVRNRTDFSGCSNCITEEEYFDFLYDKMGRKIQFPDIKGPCPLRCRNSLVIGPDGNIYKCLEFLGDKTKRIGNITNFSINLYKQSESALAYSPFDDEKCKDCSVLPICGGGCPIDRQKLKSGELKSVCSYEKNKLDSILMRLYQQRLENKS